MVRFLEDMPVSRTGGSCSDSVFDSLKKTMPSFSLSPLICFSRQLLRKRCLLAHPSFHSVNHGTPPGLVLCPFPFFFLYMPPQNPFWYSSGLCSKLQPVRHFQSANLATLPLFKKSDCFRESRRCLNSLTVSGFLC